MNSSDSQNNKKESLFDKLWFLSIIFIVLIVIILIMWDYIPGRLAKDFTLANKGLFGDSYGSVNALFTGLAFAALICTLLLQQRAIHLQRKDYLATLDEMRISSEEMTKQTKNQKDQNNIQIKQNQLLRLQIGSNIANLKIKSLEVKIAKIQMASLSVGEGRRNEVYGPELTSVKKNMEEIISNLEQLYMIA